MDEIETGCNFDIGFLLNFLTGGRAAPKGPQDIVYMTVFGHFDYVEGPQAIPAHQGPPSTPDDRLFWMGRRYDTQPFPCVMGHPKCWDEFEEL
jgi:hypothetical protein